VLQKLFESTTIEAMMRGKKEANQFGTCPAADVRQRMGSSDVFGFLSEERKDNAVITGLREDLADLQLLCSECRRKQAEAEKQRDEAEQQRDEAIKEKEEAIGGKAEQRLDAVSLGNVWKHFSSEIFDQALRQAVDEDKYMEGLQSEVRQAVLPAMTSGRLQAAVKDLLSQPEKSVVVDSVDGSLWNVICNGNFQAALRFAVAEHHTVRHSTNTLESLPAWESDQENGNMSRQISGSKGSKDSVTFELESFSAAARSKILEDHQLSAGSGDQRNQEKVKTIFSAWDSDGSGTISKAEMSDVFKTLCPTLTSPDLDQIFLSIDKDTNGHINYTELCDWLFA